MDWKSETEVSVSIKRGLFAIAIGEALDLNPHQFVPAGSRNSRA